MEKIERWIYGFCFLLGGLFLLIFAGVSLIDLLSKTIIYFLFTFAIIIMLYGVILILIGTFIMSVNIRVKKSVALIIFLIGIVIIILSITVIIIDSITIVNIFEIISGIGLIFLGINLFSHKIKLKYDEQTKKEEKQKKDKKLIGVVSFVIGLIISLLCGFLIIITMVSYNPEYLLYNFPFLVLPFLIGIILLIYGEYSIKGRKNKVVLPILRGLFILLIFLYILSIFLFSRIVLLFY